MIDKTEVIVKQKVTAKLQDNNLAIVPRKTERAGAIVINGNFQGLGIIRSLARQKVPVYVLDQEPCIGKFSRYTKKFFKCPEVARERDFFDFLVDLAVKENIRGWVIYPNDDETVSFLARYRGKLMEYFQPITPSWDITRFAYDKKLTRKIAEKCGIAYPKTYYPAGIEELKRLSLRFPVIIKPSVKEPFYSRTKKKAIQVDTRENLTDEYLKAVKLIDNSQTLMVQELIPGGTRNLFSVGSLSRNGELLARVVVKRLRQHPMDFGHATTYAETVDIPELEKATARILGEIGYHGLSEVEFMQDTRDGRYKLLEINARPWGWHTLAIAAGVDLPYLAYLDALGEKVSSKDFARGVKWLRLTTDLPTVAIEVLKGKMKLGDYFRSLRGKKRDAVLSLDDPLPFFAELAMLPYLWKKRGF